MASSSHAFDAATDSLSRWSRLPYGISAPLSGAFKKRAQTQNPSAHGGVRDLEFPRGPIPLSGWHLGVATRLPDALINAPLLIVCLCDCSDRIAHKPQKQSLAFDNSRYRR